MATEQDDELTYQYIKANFNTVDGHATVILINQIDLRNSKVSVCESLLKVDSAIAHSRSKDLPYAFISNFKRVRKIYFSGTVFRRAENLDTGEITLNKLQRRDPVDLTKLREEFLRLGELLRKGEAF